MSSALTPELITLDFIVIIGNSMLVITLYLEYLLNVKTLRKNTKLFNEYSLTQLMEPCPNTRTPEAMSFAIVVEGLPYSS